MSVCCSELLTLSNSSVRENENRVRMKSGQDRYASVFN